MEPKTCSIAILLVIVSAKYCKLLWACVYDDETNKPGRRTLFLPIIDGLIQSSNQQQSADMSNGAL